MNNEQFSTFCLFPTMSIKQRDGFITHPLELIVSFTLSIVLTALTPIENCSVGKYLLEVEIKPPHTDFLSLVECPPESAVVSSGMMKPH